MAIQKLLVEQHGTGKTEWAGNPKMSRPEPVLLKILYNTKLVGSLLKRCASASSEGIWDYGHMGIWDLWLVAVPTCF